MFNDFTISPYPGLRSFSEDESLFFKGRDTHIQEIIKLLEANKFLMVTGASGDGKSSIIFSGLVPNARAGFFKANYNRWEVAHFRPERTPVKNLAQVLSGILGNPPETLQTELNRGFGSLIDLYKGSDLYRDETTSEWQHADNEEKKAMERSTANLLVIVDQFEEFFTNPENFRNGAPTEEAQVLINLLLETASISLKEDIPIYIVFTMRSDYIGQCAAFRGLPEFIGFSQFFVPRLKRKELKQIIEEPAVLNGNAISPRLVERILYDLSEGIDQLPILQHALSQIWLMADKGKEEMDLIHYAKVGGMAADDLPDDIRDVFDHWHTNLADWQQQLFKDPGLHRILDIHADNLYEGAWEYYQEKQPKTTLSRQESKLIIAMTFACLTKIDHSRAVRNRMTLQEITNIINQPKLSTEVVGAVINIYRKQGNTFVRPFIEEDDDHSANLKPDSVLDITHESLIRNWQRLTKWADKEFEYYEIFLDFEKQLEKWLNSGKDGGYLLPIGPLTFFEKWEAECRPNKYWINRYNTSTENTDENLLLSERTLADSQEFLKKSARKVIVSKTFMRYGTMKIVTAIAVGLVFILSGFYYYDAEKKQNDRVLKKITADARPLLTSQEVSNNNKALYMLNVERVYKGAMLEELEVINDVEKQLEVALSIYNSAFLLDRTFNAPEKDELIEFIDRIIGSDKLNAEKKLYYANKFIDNLGYDYYLNNRAHVGAVLQKQTNRLLILIENIINEGKIDRVLTFNQGIENYLNWNSEPQTGAGRLVDLLSPFDTKSYSTFKQFYPQEGGILNGRRGNITHNGGYQEIASLLAALGNLPSVKQATDSLLQYNKNYFNQMTFNNGTNVLGYFAQFGHRAVAEEYLQYLSTATGISKRSLMNTTLDHGGYIKYFYKDVRMLEEGNYNPNLSILYRKTTDFLFDLKEKVIKEEESGDAEFFHLSLLYKQRGAYLSWQQQLSANKIDNQDINGWFDKALDHNKKVSAPFKLEREEINYRYFSDGIRRRTFSRKYFFLYPDYFYDQWHSDKFVSTAFMEYLLNNNLLGELYETTADLEIINDWLANYNEVYPQLNESRGLTPFKDNVLSQTLEAIESHPLGAEFDKTFLQLSLANRAFKAGDDEQGLQYFQSLEINKMGPLANRWQYLSYTAIYNQLLSLAKYLAVNNHHNEAIALVEVTPDYSYRTYIYGLLASHLYINHYEAKAFVYLDSALTNENKMVTSTLQFLIDPNYSIIATLSGIGGTQLNEKAREMFAEMPPLSKGGGLFNYILGISWGGNYHRAVMAIPEQGSSDNTLQHYTLILGEEGNKIGSREGWERLARQWNFVAKDYIYFRDQN
jgi:Novel STAND NTPase 1